MQECQTVAPLLFMAAHDFVMIFMFLDGLKRTFEYKHTHYLFVLQGDKGLKIG